MGGGVIDLAYLKKIGALIDLKGREYLTHSGLLRAAHDAGIESIGTDLIRYDAETKTAILKATVSGARGAFTGYGDASPANVARHLREATLRMAETRAINRALRLYLGIGRTTVEELPGDRDNGDRQPTAAGAEVAQGAREKRSRRRTETAPEKVERQTRHHRTWPATSRRLAVRLRALGTELVKGQAFEVGVPLDAALAYVEQQGETPLSQRDPAQLKVWLEDLLAAWTDPDYTGPLRALFEAVERRPVPRRQGGARA